MFNVKKMLLGAVVAAAGLFSGSPAASASPITLTGDIAHSTAHTGANFQATFNYVNATSLLTLSLTNTTPSMEAGDLTGFVFDIDKAGNTAVLQSTSNASFLDLATSSHANATLAAPFGTFQDGAALGGMWEGGGNPNNGITAGQTATFTFKVTGANALTLNTADFVHDGFVARFKNLCLLSSSGSDKVPSLPTAAPLPASAWAGVMGLVALGAVGLKRRRRSIEA